VTDSRNQRADVRSGPTSAVFTDAIALTPAEPEHFDLAFTATTQPCPWPKAYGGDMVAQATAAAMRSVEGKTLHSMHSYFLRPVDIGAEVRYEVELLRDGRGYATRQVRGYQNGKPVYTCLATSRRASRAPPRAEPPVGVPDPPNCPARPAYLRDTAAPRGTMTDTSEEY